MAEIVKIILFCFLIRQYAVKHQMMYLSGLRMYSYKATGISSLIKLPNWVIKAGVQVSPLRILYSFGWIDINTLYITEQVCNKTSDNLKIEAIFTFFACDLVFVFGHVYFTQYLLFLNALVARKRDVECPKDINILYSMQLLLSTHTAHTACWAVITVPELRLVYFSADNRNGSH